MKLYNSLSKQKEDFTPIHPGQVEMYHCGPTVYDYVHIGNLRSFLLADFLRRSFEYLGYEVNQVMNITDVGHLVSDGDEGDDKMTKALKREGKEISVENMLAVGTKYAEAFRADINALNMLVPQHIPRASEYIKQNIELIHTLEEKGYTYTISDGVYFDTSKMPEYGKLGGLVLENETESRIGTNNEKQHQADFALWKFDNNLGWDSPWGHGFPGWHIECSTMSRAFLGDHFDIHTGGIDNAPIHHNNEIAQSTCATGGQFVNYWLHGAMLNFGGAKLSKSTGGNITLRSLEEKGIVPLAYRYMTLQTHYRSPMNFSFEGLEAAQRGLEKIYRDIIKLRNDADAIHGTVSGNFRTQFTAKIEDDLNLPQALAVFHDMLKSDISSADKLVTAYDFDQVLGLRLETYQETEVQISNELQELLDQRKRARENKDFALSDDLRARIADMGYIVSDNNDEQRVDKK
ncbi:cysteine--tRNA ligase [Patescibacteria group bacterium]|nr:cysteine--tRNA ligase [Patescibacteria group bacterium]